MENYTTTVSAGKTASEIQALLAAHGVQRLMLEYADGKPTGVAFQMETEFGSRLFQLPVNVDAMHQLLIREKRAKRLPGISETLDNSREQARSAIES